MTRYALDTDGMTRTRLGLAEDPEQLRACASLVATATADAMSAVGPEGGCVRVALERFGTVHAHGLDFVADAAGALADQLDRSTVEAQEVELFVTRSLTHLATNVPATLVGSADVSRP